MSTPLPGRRRRVALTVLPVLASLGLAGAAHAAPALAPDSGDGDHLDSPTFGGAKVTAPATFTDGRYIVITRDKAVATDPTTAAAPGGKLDMSAPKAVAKQRQLRSKHAALAASVGVTPARDYTVAVSGFAAKLTAKQAQELSADRSVLAVVPDEARHLDTWSTPGFLGLDGRKGVWKQVGGVNKAGDGVVVGDLDSGIWPESPSFAAKPLPNRPTGPWRIVKNAKGGATMSKADGGVFSGACQTGEEWTQDDCNQKIVGARYYPDTFVKYVAPEHRAPTERLSPRDGGGHGTHTASTAAGNHGVDMTVEGRNFGKGSGIAPAAKLAIYKVCFDDDNPDTGGCYSSATLAAVDDAITDGVDVINYSISGSLTTSIDPVELAFEGAAEAGIFISASAGNSGPTPSTVAHNSPWLMTVASATHVAFENTLVLGNGVKIKGASINSTPVGPLAMVDAATSGLPDADPAQAKLCAPNTLDPAKVTGKMVVCARGVYARVDKSKEVKRAGGSAMVLANLTPSSLDADFHSIPTIHIDDVAAKTVYAYLATQYPTGSIVVGDTTGAAKTAIPQISGFSSRGPALANDSDLLKPDIAAPGSSVLAAVAPPSNEDRDFDLYSGTSMAAPHITGLAALYFGVHPNWTPMAIKSAMMTTAYDLFDAQGKKIADPFAQGAGHVDPTKMLDPGLLVLSGPSDWRGFITGQGMKTDVPAIPASDLNYPSIAKGQVPGVFKTSRTFTAQKLGGWTVDVQVPGFSAKYRKGMAFNRIGQEGRLDITFTRTTAPIGKWATGFVTLTGPTTVRMPVALRPVSVSAPATVKGSGESGSVTVPLIGGMTGQMKIGTAGLAEGKVTSETLAAGGSKQIEVDVPEGSTFARFDLNLADNDADFDLYVYRCAPKCTKVAQSAGGPGDERVDIPNPAAGTYVALIDGYDPGPNRTAEAYTFTSFVMNPATDTGNLTVKPNPVSLKQGRTTDVEVSWSGIDPTKPYLGMLTYEGALAPTMIEIGG